MLSCLPLTVYYLLLFMQLSNCYSPQKKLFSPDGQFHQHFTRKFFVRMLHAAFLKLRFGFVAKEKLPKRRSYEKFARKMLMKLTPNLSIGMNGRVKSKHVFYVTTVRNQLSFDVNIYTLGLNVKGHPVL